MQITIDTERDDLDQVARVIAVLNEKQACDLDRLRHRMGVQGSATGRKLAVEGIRPDTVYKGDELSKALHTSDPVQQLVEDAEEETLPEHPPVDNPGTIAGGGGGAADPAAVFGNVKGASLFDQELGKSNAQTATETAGIDTPKPPTADVTPATEPANGEIDAAGTPWDERIHASTKTKVADGTWKKKRGVDQELYNEVMAEINDGPKPAADDQTESVVQPGAVTPPPPPPVPSAPPAPPVGELDFPGFVRMVTDKANNVSAASIAEACQAEGVASFPLLQQNPDKIPAVAKRLGLA